MRMLTIIGGVLMLLTGIFVLSTRDRHSWRSRLSSDW